MRIRMKKSMGKRVLSVLLAMTMCLSMGTMRVQAETGSSGDGTENTIQINGLDFSDGSVDAEAISAHIENHAYNDQHDDWRVDLVITLPKTMESEEAWANLRKGIREAKVHGESVYVDLTLKGITTIPSGQNGEGVFYGATLLESIFLPSVTSLGSYAFSGCGSFDKICFESVLSTVDVNGFSCDYPNSTILVLSSKQTTMKQKLDGETLIGWEADVEKLSFGTNEFCGVTFRDIQCTHEIVELVSYKVNEKDVFQHIKTCANCETTVVEDHTLSEDGVCTDCGYTPSYLYVGGIPVTSANADDVLGDEDAGATVRYDASTNVLTLENAAIQGVEAVRGAGIYATGNDTLVLKLKGINTITGTYSDDWHVDAGVYSDVQLKIQGEGKLTTTVNRLVSEGNTYIPEVSAGIFAREGMSMTSGTLHAIGGDASEDSSGVYAFCYDGYNLSSLKISPISISGGTVTLESGNICSENSSVAIQDTTAAAGDMDLSGYPYAQWTQAVTTVVEGNNGESQEVTVIDDPRVVPFTGDSWNTGYLHIEPGNYQIAPQPAQENGYTVNVQVRDENQWIQVTDPILYQWYQNVEKTVVPNPTAEEQLEGIFLENIGTYNDGYWESLKIGDQAHALYVAVQAVAGDQVTITMKEHTDVMILVNGESSFMSPGSAYVVKETDLVRMSDIENTEPVEGEPTYVVLIMVGESSFGAKMVVNSLKLVNSTAQESNRFNSAEAGNYFCRVTVSKPTASQSGDGDGIVAIMETESFDFVPIYEVTFDAGVGQCDTESKETELGTAKFEDTYELPVAVLDDYTFLGWVTEEGEAVTEETIYDRDTTVYAQWAVKVEQAPEIVDGLTYTDSAQELITAGAAGLDGTMMYSLSQDGEYSASIPTANAVGTYTIWYYAAAPENSGLKNSEISSLSVGIGKAAGSAMVNMDSWTYLDVAAVPQPASTTNGITGVTYLYESTDGKGYSSATVPTDAGAYKVIATFAETDNYLGCTAEDAFIISPRSIQGAQITLNTSKLVYTGSELEQVVESVKLGDINVDTYTISGNKNTKVGVYSLTVTGTGNFCDRVTVTYIIYPDASVLEGLTEGNVTSAEQEPLEELQKALEEAEDTLADDALRGEWNDLLKDTEELLDQIQETQDQIQKIQDTIGDQTKDTATSDDKEKLNQALEDMEELLAGGNLTEQEKEAFAEAKMEAQGQLKQIEDAEKATGTDDIENAKDIDENTVIPEDQDKLERALKDLKDAQKNYKDNYTEEEKKELQDEIDRVEGALQELKDVKSFGEQMGQLPDSVETDDMDTAMKVEAAKKIYDRLSDNGKSMLDEAAVKQLKDLLKDLSDYQLLEGSGAVWTKESHESLRFKANGGPRKVLAIEVDGKVVDARYYTIEEGSTIVKIKAEYLEMLQVGAHTFKLKYTDGEVKCLFTIESAPEKPAEPSAPADSGAQTPPMTGDMAQVGLWFAMFTVSLAGIVVLAVTQRKKRVD